MNLILFLSMLVLFCVPFGDPFLIRLSLASLLVLDLAVLFLQNKLPRFNLSEKLILLFSFWVVFCLSLKSYVGVKSLALEYLTCFFVLVFFSRVCRKPEWWALLGKTYVHGCVAASLILLSNWVFGKSIEYGVVRYSVSDAVNANYLAYCLAVAFPVIVALGWSRKITYVKYYVCVAVIIFMSMSLTGCRGAVISTIFCIVLLIFRLYVTNIAVGIYSMAAVFFVAVVGYLFMPESIINRLTFSNYGANNANDLSSGRLDQWQDAFYLIDLHPYIGNGPYSFVSYRASPSGEYGDQLHNVFLNITVEFGVIGLVLYLICVLSVFYSVFRKKNPVWSKWIALIVLFGWFFIASTGIWAYSVAAWFLFAWLLKIPVQKNRSTNLSGN